MCNERSYELYCYKYVENELIVYAYLQYTPCKTKICLYKSPVMD